MEKRKGKNPAEDGPETTGPAKQKEKNTAAAAENVPGGGQVPQKKFCLKKKEAGFKGGYGPTTPRKRMNTGGLQKKPTATAYNSWTKRGRGTRGQKEGADFYQTWFRADNTLKERFASHKDSWKPAAQRAGKKCQSREGTPPGREKPVQT